MGKGIKQDLKNFEEVVKLLKSRKTTIECVLSKLQDMVQSFQTIKEDFYLEELKEQIEKEAVDPEEMDIDAYAGKIEQLVFKDTKAFVNTYVKETNDKILDAVNEKILKKDPAFAFLILLQIMQQAFDKNDDDTNNN